MKQEWQGEEEEKKRNRGMDGAEHQSKVEEDEGSHTPLR